MIETSLREFFNTGRLGQISFDSKREDILDSLGGPNDWGYGKTMSGSSIWKFECLQIGFFKGTVSFLGFYFENPTNLPDSLKMDGFFPNNTTTLAEFASFLNSEGIPYWIEPFFTTEEQVGLRTSIGIQVIFYEKNLIHSIQYTIDSRLKALEKPVN